MCAKTALGPTVHPEVQESTHCWARACVIRVPGDAGSEPARRHAQAFREPAADCAL